MPLAGAYNPNFGAANTVALGPAQSWLVGPGAGQYQIVLDRYHVLQYKDPISDVWRGAGTANAIGGISTVQSDGNNVRIANQTGCAVGALLTNAGSGYTSAPAVSASAGGSKWRAIVGGAVSTTVTITNAGQNYTYPPICVIDAPPFGGIQATATCSLSSGTIGSVTIVDQGAGYINVPNISFVNDYREIIASASSGITVGYQAAAVLQLTGAQTVTGLMLTNLGTGAVSSLPTLTFTGGGGSSAAATVIMNWTVVSINPSTAGAGLAGTHAYITGLDQFPATSPAYTNPTTQKNLVFLRQANIRDTLSGTGLSATYAILDGGCYSSQPDGIVIPTASVVTTAPFVSLGMGGAAGVSLVMRTQ